MQRLRPGLLVLAVLLVLAGCGDDGNGEGVGDADPEGGATTPAEPTTGPPAEPEPEPEPEPGPERYEVQQGDTLWGIAERFGVSVDAIVDANDIDDPSQIFPGDELVIPAAD